MAGEIYIVRGTPITWRTSGGDEVLNLGGLTSGNVRVGSFHDFGAYPRPDAFEWFLEIDGFTAAATVGQAVIAYLTRAWDDNSGTPSLWTGPESPVGGADGPGSINRLPNLKRIGSVAVVSATAGDNAVDAGEIQMSARHVAPVIHNNTVNTLLSAAEAHRFILTPLYYQSQP